MEVIANFYQNLFGINQLLFPKKKNKWSYKSITKAIVNKRYDLRDDIISEPRAKDTDDHNICLFISDEPSLTLQEKAFWILSFDNVYPKETMYRFFRFIFTRHHNVNIKLYLWVHHKYGWTVFQPLYLLIGGQCCNNFVPYSKADVSLYEELLEFAMRLVSPVMFIQSILLGLDRTNFALDDQEMYKDLPRFETIDWNTNVWLRRTIYYLTQRPINKVDPPFPEYPQEDYEKMVARLREILVQIDKDLALKDICDPVDQVNTPNRFDYILHL